MIRRLVVLGASGDLTGRYLLPALARLAETSCLPEGFEITGIAQDDWDDGVFRGRAQEWLQRHAGDVDAEARARVCNAVRYRRADVTRPDELAPAVEPRRGAAVVYLALPPVILPETVASLAALDLAEGSRVVVEKPFGTGLESARRLNRALGRAFAEPSIFRVDHFLSKQTVQNVLGLRFANRVFEPIWNREHIESVDIVWDETLRLEGRAGYYDGTGALRDMIQNHLLQVMCLVAMDPPTTLGERDLRDRKYQLLRAVRAPAPGEAAHRTTRAQYTAGRADGREVVGYRDEPGVDPGSATETLAEVTLSVDSWRWAGVPFRLRSGKALAADRREVVVRFRPVPHLAFGQQGEPAPNHLRLELEPDRLALSVSINGPGDPFDLECIELDHELEPHELPAYARLLVDVLEGDPALSIRADEAEEAWRILEPVLDAWGGDRVPLVEYPAGSSGPPRRS